MRELFIADRRIADEEPAYLVAEVGHNHQGSVDRAKEIIAAAAAAGFHAAKLQKRSNRDLFTRELYDSPYNSENAFGSTYGEHRKALEFGWDEYSELMEYTHGLGLAFGATAFDFPSAEFLDRLGVDFFKIASGDLKTTPLIRQVAHYGRPVIISTGGGDDAAVEGAWCVAASMNRNFALLQCTAAYPCPSQELNLRVIAGWIKNYPHTVIGLSDHQDGISMAPVAYALGARIFEKHCTFSHSAKGSDHAFSLEPHGMAQYAKGIRDVEVALGDGIKRCYESEEGPLYKMGKSITAARDLPKGHIIDAGDFEYRSPSGGLEPWKADKLLGRKLVTSIGEGEIIDTSGVFVPWD